MGTTADKFNKLAQTKADLKAALAEKGQTVGDVFADYPAAVRAIETGGQTETSKAIVDAHRLSTIVVIYILNEEIASKTVAAGTTEEIDFDAGSMLIFFDESLGYVLRPTVQGVSDNLPFYSNRIWAALPQGGETRYTMIAYGGGGTRPPTPG